jgi:ferrous iron transport protein B
VKEAIGRAATHPLWGLPILALVLLLAYKVVGVFGAGTAVDFVEKRVFGGVVARAALDAPPAPEAEDFAADGTERLRVRPASNTGALWVMPEVKKGGAYVPDPAARVDLYPSTLRAERMPDGSVLVQPVAGAEARVWTGALNRWAYRFFAWIGVPILTAFFVGPYGLITMGVTYAVAIVLPVVTTFFFVFSMLEDSGYLPRLAVMSNRVLRGMGLNGKAVLPMVLGLGCDTMATLTARIMETRKERMLVTLLLALGIPCSSQLSVIFALMQRASPAATFVWLAVVISTLLGVGYVAARVLPGDKSDFLLEMPPIRQPMVQNIVAKTMARIEWYLKEAVPLFLAGTALLFVLDAAHLLVFVHRAGEPIVRHVLGFSDEAGVSDRVSEALLVGFLRRDFGAAGLLDLARAGRLSPADVAVSMVTITLFIPCIANVFMIAKERGWKVAGAMSGFIFPYAIAVGAVVRLGFRMLGGS